MVAIRQCADDADTASGWARVCCGRYPGREFSLSTLEKLCSTYRNPVVDYLQQQDYGTAEALRLADEFFSHLLKGNFLRYLDAESGRFRCFVQRTPDCFLADEWLCRWNAGSVADSQFRNPEPKRRKAEKCPTAAQVFDRRWALTVLERAMARLDLDGISSGKPELYHALKSHLSGATQPDYASLASFGLSDGTARIAVHRLRVRFGELLRAEVRETVESDELVSDEIQRLRSYVT